MDVEQKENQNKQSNKEIPKKDLLFQSDNYNHNPASQSVSLNKEKSDNFFSTSSIEFDIINEEEIKNYAKSFKINKKKDKKFANKTDKEFSLNESENNSPKIDLLKESILIEYKRPGNSGVWNSFSNKISSISYYLKYNILPTTRQLKIKDLTYLTLFDRIFSSKEFQSKEFDFHLKKIFSFTYRTNFADLPSKRGFYNSDCGWGCMIRASQMMLSKALLEQKIYNLTKLKREKNEKKILKNSIIDANEILKANQQENFEINLSDNELYEIRVNTLCLFFDNLISFEEKDCLLKKDFEYFFKNYLQILQKKEKEINNNRGFLCEEISGEKGFKEKNEEVSLEIKGIYAPFSIQNITKLGVLYDAGPGIWFSDAKMIKIYKEIFEQLDLFANDVKIFAFDNGVVEEKEIFEECFTEEYLNCFPFCKKKKNGIINNENANENANDNTNENTNAATDVENFNWDLIDSEKNNNLPESDYNREIFDERKNNIKEEEEEENDKEEEKDNDNDIKKSSICHKCFLKYKSEYKEYYNTKILEIDFNNNYNKEDNNNNIVNKKFFKLKKSGFLFISVRHGLESIGKEYHDPIKRYFKIPNNLGIIGGKNYMGLYFIGVYENKLIYLDPHLSQKSITNIKSLYQSGYESYDPKNFYYLDIENLSPGFTMGFYFRDVSEYKILRASLSNHVEDFKYSLFSFEKMGGISKSKTEELKIKETIEDGFSLIDIEDDF